MVLLDGYNSMVGERMMGLHWEVRLNVKCGSKISVALILMMYVSIQ